jgi:hypothetical protein
VYFEIVSHGTARGARSGGGLEGKAAANVCPKANRATAVEKLLTICIVGVLGAKSELDSCLLTGWGASLGPGVIVYSSENQRSRWSIGADGR